MIVTKDDEINQVDYDKPHLVILGAGASIAALPDGDKYGKKLPSMDNLIEVLDLKNYISKLDIKTKSNNFEDIYSALYDRADIRDVLERKVYDYFVNMELPDIPTIYDYLVLSLREKDYIATFNWDPFLVQAVRRNSKYCKPPKLLFLHGNVEVGYCPNGHLKGNIGSKCDECGEILIPTRLLYPIGKKDYHKDKFISRQWEALQEVMKQTFMITIFGYGAPKSDISAVELMKFAWGDTDKRMFEVIEIINIEPKEDLIDKWSPFVHTHHYRIKKSFYDSWIANHPRRTGEAYKNQFCNAEFIDNNPFPETTSFDELWYWFDTLNAVEKNYKEKK